MNHFFRNQVKSYMTEAGYDVIEGEDGQIAWDLLQENRDLISLVVTDIEMPNMNGFELTQTIKNDPRFSGLPVIALTTLAGEEDIAKGKAVGVDEYHIKLDKERLMASVHDYIKRLY
jgi:two-component system chemotaxis sensor kinase CheA